MPERICMRPMKSAEERSHKYNINAMRNISPLFKIKEPGLIALYSSEFLRT